MLHNRQTIVTLIALALAAVLAACGGPGEPVEPPDEGNRSELVNEGSALEGTEWVLTSLNGRGLVEGSNITLNFVEGQVTGFAGCNRYGGEYTAADEGTLTIPEIEITCQLCQRPEGIMQQENTYTEALRNAAAYQVMDDRRVFDAVAESLRLP